MVLLNKFILQVLSSEALMVFFNKLVFRVLSSEAFMVHKSIFTDFVIRGTDDLFCERH